MRRVFKPLARVGFIFHCNRNVLFIKHSLTLPHDDDVVTRWYVASCFLIAFPDYDKRRCKASSQSQGLLHRTLKDSNFHKGLARPRDKFLGGKDQTNASIPLARLHPSSTRNSCGPCIICFNEIFIFHVLHMGAITLYNRIVSLLNSILRTPCTHLSSL